MQRIWLFIWRFQPIHLGHISAIQQLLELNLDDIVIGIGSSNSKFSQENPFSYLQREALVKSSLDIHFPDHAIQIVPIPDTSTDAEWTDMIIKNIQPTHIISWNPWTIECFRNHPTIEITQPTMAIPISATFIRQARRDHNLSSVQSYLDPHVFDFLESLSI